MTTGTSSAIWYASIFPPPTISSYPNLISILQIIVSVSCCVCTLRLAKFPICLACHLPIFPRSVLIFWKKHLERRVLQRIYTRSYAKIVSINNAKFELAFWINHLNIKKIIRVNFWLIIKSHFSCLQQLFLIILHSKTFKTKQNYESKFGDGSEWSTFK